MGRHTDAAKSLGPTLAEINKKYPQHSELLLHVLEPSRKIEDKFAAVAVQTTRGQVLTGLVVRESKTEVVLRTADKKEVTLPRAEIDELSKSPKSLMPDGILADLTAQEAADLMAYIRQLAAAP